MAQGWLQIALFLVVLTALVHAGRRLHGPGLPAASASSSRPVLGPIERLTYRVLRVRPDDGQDWKAYARSIVVFSAALLARCST